MSGSVMIAPDADALPVGITVDVTSALAFDSSYTLADGLVGAVVQFVMSSWYAIDSPTPWY